MAGMEQNSNPWRRGRLVLGGTQNTHLCEACLNVNNEGLLLADTKELETRRIRRSFLGILLVECNFVP